MSIISYLLIILIIGICTLFHYGLIVLIMCIVLIMSLCSHITSFQVRVDLGLRRTLRNHKWQDRHPAFARTVDNLGDLFCPAMRTSWLAYIKKAYGEAAPAAASCKVQGTLVVEDDHQPSLPPRPEGKGFCHEN